MLQRRPWQRGVVSDPIPCAVRPHSACFSMSETHCVLELFLLGMSRAFVGCECAARGSATEYHSSQTRTHIWSNTVVNPPSTSISPVALQQVLLPLLKGSIALIPSDPLLMSRVAYLYTAWIPQPHAVRLPRTKPQKNLRVAE